MLRSFVRRLHPLFSMALVLGFVTTASVSAAPRVYRDQVDPQWIVADGRPTDRFWYRVEIGPSRREFVLVDAAIGKREPAFDHARVAAALSARLGREVSADSLPIDALEFAEDGSSVKLQGRFGAWMLDLASHELTPTGRSAALENTLRARREARPSRASDRVTSILFVNSREQAVDLFWLTPDGGRRFYASLEPGEERDQNTYAGHAWLVAGKTGETIAVFVGEERPGLAAITDPMEFPERPRRRPRADEDDSAGVSSEGARSPDGRWEVLVRDDNLVLRELREVGAETPLTRDATPFSSYARNAEARRAVQMNHEAGDPPEPTPEVYWSPDSRRFVAMRHTPGAGRRVTLVESSPRDQLQPKTIVIPYLKPGDEVPYAKPHLFDPEARREIPLDDTLFENPWSIDDLRWARDSGEFTFLFNQRGHQALRIVGVNAADGAVRAIVDETSETFVCYSQKYFCEYLDATREIVWMSERDGWNHLYLYDAATGRVKNQITRGEWVVRGVDRVDGDARQVWFRASGMNPGEDPYHVHHYRIGFDGSGLVALTSGDGTHEVRYSPDRRHLIDTWSRVDRPPITELRRSSDGSLVCRLEEADVSELVADGWRPPERFVAKGRDGVTDIYGIIIRPKNFDPAKTYPVLEDIYAGPHDSFTPKAFSARFRNQELADRGFIVVKLDGMGTSNRSKAFHDVAWKNVGDAGFPDRILWMRAAAASRPEMDLTRVGIFGTSAGGQSAMRAVLDHADFYRAAVADCGCHDNRVDKIWWNEQWMGWPVDESYVRSSNVADAHKLDGKLLLMVGELDKNVDPASTFQVVDALIRADKDFELLVVPGGGHGSAATPYGSRRLTEFFTRAFLDGHPE